MINTIPFLDYSKEHEEIRETYLREVSDIVRSGRFSLGPHVESFEHDFAAYCGCRYAVAVNSGTAALVTALLAAGIGVGSEVIIPAMTFVATATAVLSVGAVPVLVDVGRETCCLDPEKLDAAMSERTKAIIPVHLYGRLADMDAINDFAARHGICVIEDAAQAHGAQRHGVRSGAIGNIGCFSFYPGKNLGGAGEGGIVTTSDENVARRAKGIRDWGQAKKGIYGLPGSNYRMDAMQAAFLALKLPSLDRWNADRRRIASRYARELPKDLLLASDDPLDDSHVFHIFSVFTPNRESFRKALTQAGIETGVHYPRALHQQPALGGYRVAGGLMASKNIARQQLSLPIFPAMTEGQIDRVVDAIHGAAAK